MINRGLEQNARRHVVIVRSTVQRMNSETFQIKLVKHGHNFCREMNNKQANREWVVNKLEAKLRIQPTLKCA